MKSLTDTNSDRHSPAERIHIAECAVSSISAADGPHRFHFDSAAAQYRRMMTGARRLTPSE